MYFLLIWGSRSRRSFGRARNSFFQIDSRVFSFFPYSIRGSLWRFPCRDAIRELPLIVRRARKVVAAATNHTNQQLATSSGRRMQAWPQSSAAYRDHRGQPLPPLRGEIDGIHSQMCSGKCFQHCKQWIYLFCVVVNVDAFWGVSCLSQWDAGSFKSVQEKF